MRGKGFVASVATAGMTAAMALAAPTGAGASTMLAFFGWAGGSQVRALDSTISSDLSASSGISTFNPNLSASNATATVVVSGLLATKDIATSAASKEIPGGYSVTSRAQTGNVNLLGGAITVQAITTTARSTLVNGVASSTVDTAFVGINIVGTTLPVNIPKNFNVTIPGLASVALNASRTLTVGTTTVGSGAGIMVTLLRPVGNAAAGTTIYIAPVYSRLGDVDYENTGHTARGAGYGSQVTAAVGTLVGVQSDPTALVNLTPGKTNTVSVAAVNLSSTLKLGAITNTADGLQTTAVGEAHVNSKIAGLNLFGGLITADAVESDAKVSAPTNMPVAVTGYSKLVNLVIAGNKIPVDVGPNTKIDLGFAVVTLNQQIRSANQMVVRALDIKINTASYGLPAGAEVQLAVAGASAS